MALLDIQNLVADIARDVAARVSTEQRDRAIGIAVRRLSIDKPRVLVEDLVGSDSQALALPAEWVSGESVISWLEYPAGALPPVEVSSADYRLTMTPIGDALVLSFAVPATAAVRMVWTGPHTLDDSTDTIPTHQHEAVACYAAAWMCDQLSAEFSANTDPTIAADSVDQSNPARNYAARAKTYRARYYELLGLVGYGVSGGGAGGKPLVPPAAATQSVTPVASDGRPTLFKRR